MCAYLPSEGRSLGLISFALLIIAGLALAFLFNFIFGEFSVLSFGFFIISLLLFCIGEFYLINKYEKSKKKKI